MKWFKKKNEEKVDTPNYEHIDTATNDYDIDVYIKGRYIEEGDVMKCMNIHFLDYECAEKCIDNGYIELATMGLTREWTKIIQKFKINGKYKVIVVEPLSIYHEYLNNVDFIEYLTILKNNNIISTQEYKEQINNKNKED